MPRPRFERNPFLPGCLMAALLLSLILSAPAAAAGGDYVGWKGCEACHEKISTDWQGTKHARAFRDLTKSGQDGLPACVSCHVTGQGRPGGFIDKEITPHLAGVQCEACHGPGRQHAASGGGKAPVTAPRVETCRQCHTPAQDPGFDYAKKARGVHQAQEGALKPAQATPLSALPDRFDFGAVNEGTSASTTVAVQNTGDKAVTVTNVRTN